MVVDEDMTRQIRAAIDRETAGIYYRGAIPELRGRSIWSPPAWAAIPIAAAAVAAAALVGPLVHSMTGDRDLGVDTVQVASNPTMLADLLGATSQPGQPGSAGVSPHHCLESPSPECAARAGDPYPLVTDTRATVPADARPYAPLTGLDGEVTNGWVGQDDRPGRGASVWLQYPDHVTELSTRSLATGKKLADYLASHPF